ncbi:MAG: hypothetical protein V3V01_08340, partial [Acidimicrobiales bacterium]
MPISAVRPPGGCLAPVALDFVVDDPESIRRLARSNGPYFQPGRYLVDAGAAQSASAGETKQQVEIPKGLVGPVFRGDWAVDGEAILGDAQKLLTLPAFIDAAKTICNSEFVVPEQVFVNLTTPCGGQPFSHTDVPEFRGVGRKNAPGWLLLVMGGSRCFEPERITIITAVSWFFQGERGYFRYWPDGRDADSLRHEDLWNSAVVGDNDFMHHKVERVGPRDLRAPAEMTIDSELRFDGSTWLIEDAGKVLASYDDEYIRLSLSWKAKVYGSDAERRSVEAGVDGLTIDEVLARLETAFGEPLATSGPDALSSPELRD